MNKHSNTKSKTQARTQWFLVLLGAAFAIAGFSRVVLVSLPKLLAAIDAKQNLLQEEIWGGLIIGGVFLLTGLSAMKYGFKLRQDNVRASTLPKLTDGAKSLDPTTHSQTLKPYQGGSWRTFQFLLTFAIVWNGIVIFAKPQNSSPIMWIFVLVGVVIAAITIRQGLVLLNPKVTLTVHDLPLTMGSRANVIWQVGNGSTRTSKISEFSIELIGQEQATYHRGTDTYTDTHDFHSKLYEISQHQLQGGQGSIRLQIPTVTMHTWHSQNNQVVWLLHVRGKIHRWPDIDEKYEITVFPTEMI